MSKNFPTLNEDEFGCEFKNELYIIRKSQKRSIWIFIFIKKTESVSNESVISHEIDTNLFEEEFDLLNQLNQSNNSTQHNSECSNFQNYGNNLNSQLQRTNNSIFEYYY